MNLFTDDVRRNPYPVYGRIRAECPLVREPQSGHWMVFDYNGARRVLGDQEVFSSRYGPDWLNFIDPPRHSKLRALVSRAFTPKSVVNLEGRIRDISRGLLDRVVARGEMDMAADYAVPLPIMVIGEMLGIPADDGEKFKRWVDVILRMSYTIGRRDEEAAMATRDFAQITGEMNEYMDGLLAERKIEPKDDLLTRLSQAEVDGERLTQAEILGFFQLLLLAGSETTTNLINNAMLCFMEHPEELAKLRGRMELLPGAIEEVLRFRSPVQWIYRVNKSAVTLHGQEIAAGNLVLAIIGSANHDPKQFSEPERFDITRDPNPHIGFGIGMHFCMGAPLARLEGRIALGDLLERLGEFKRMSDEPWVPRKGLHVMGPARLEIGFSGR